VNQSPCVYLWGREIRWEEVYMAVSVEQVEHVRAVNDVNPAVLDALLALNAQFVRQRMGLAPDTEGTDPANSGGAVPGR
jgi:hypothetical protein